MRISDLSSDVCSSDLLEGVRGKDLENTRRRIDAIIRPDLGQHRVSKLESKTITDWMNKLASSPARLRTAKGADQNYREMVDSERSEERRVGKECVSPCRSRWSPYR